MIPLTHPDIIGDFDVPPEKVLTVPTETALTAPPETARVSSAGGCQVIHSRRRNQSHDRARTLEVFNRSRLDCAKASDANPGSEEKVATMAARYEAGLPIFHPHDREEHRNELLMSNLLAYLQDAPADDAEREDDEPDSDEFDLGGEG